MSGQPRRQRQGPISNASRLARSEGGTERVLDILICDAGKHHDVRMEWETRGGTRTGQMIPWCWTCRAAVQDPATPPPKDSPRFRYNTRDRRGA